MRRRGVTGWQAIWVGAVVLATVACSAERAPTSVGAASLSPGATPSPAVVAAPVEQFARTPVLFVHGHGSSSAAFQPLLDHLAGSSHPPDYLLALDIVPNNSPNVHAAEQFIAPAVDTLLRRAAAAADRAGYAGPKPAKVDIVAHSMGALSSRWYATQIRPDRVRTWISVAGANHGTDLGCSFQDQTAAQLCPAFSHDPLRQPLQVELNGIPSAPIDESPFGVGPDRPGVPTVPAEPERSIAYFTVRIANDQLILPPTSAELDGAGGMPVPVPTEVQLTETSPGNYLFEEPTDHDAIIRDAAFHRLVSALLDAG